MPVNLSHEQKRPLPAEGTEPSMPSSGQNNVQDLQECANGRNIDEQIYRKRAENRKRTS
jgi:hypothetical protein